MHTRSDGIGGNGSCPLHGGKSTGAKSDTRRHGLYASKLHPDMLADFNAAPVGNLDDDIKLSRAKVASLLQRCNDQAGGNMLQPLSTDTSVTWSSAIRSEQAHLRRLEATRAQINALDAGEEPPPTKINLIVNEIEGVGLDDV